MKCPNCGQDLKVPAYAIDFVIDNRMPAVTKCNCCDGAVFFKPSLYEVSAYKGSRIVDDFGASIKWKGL